MTLLQFLRCKCICLHHNKDDVKYVGAHLSGESKCVPGQAGEGGEGQWLGADDGSSPRIDRDGATRLSHRLAALHCGKRPRPCSGRVRAGS